ncbi:MAG: TonB-dependent outer rane transport protein [Gemmatimonadetes bacterium]|nr:TonB-dependent outer rane transport protein [Gemmatimonadota bacterium]
MRTLSIVVLLFAVSAGANAQQSSSGSIAGTIVTAEQQPLAGARVEAVSAGRTVARSNAREDGSFRLDLLPAGSYRVVASRIGYGRQEQTTTIVPGQTAQVRIVMTSAPAQLTEVTTTASRRQEKILDAPASVSVVTTEEVAERPALTIMDNVRTLPGVDVAQGGLVQSAIVARGFNNIFSGQMLTLIDNRFASVPSLRVNVPFLFTASNEDIERIEVLLGPAAALYGPNSANGVLHIITKSPFTSQGTTFTVDGGERSVLRLAGRHAGVVGNSLGFKLTGEYMRGRDWEFLDPAEPRVFPNTPNTPRARVGQPNSRDFDIERYGGEARLDWRLGDNAEWINTYGVTNGANTVELTGANGAGQLRDWMIQSFQSRLRAGKLFAQVFANLSDAGNSDSTDLSGTYLLRTGQPIVDKSRVIGGQLQHAADFGTKNSLVYGLDYTFTNPRTGGTINGRNEDDDNTSEIGGYAQSTTRLSPMWDVLLAARLDRHNRLDGTFFSPRAALVFKPAEGQSWRLTFNRAYSTPANFSFFLDLLQAGNISGLPYNVRAVGVKDGFRFRRDCTGGLGSLCMRSPFTPAAAGGSATFVPANAAGYYPAALQVAIAGGLRNSLLASGLPAAAVDATIARLGTFNASTANVGTRLTYITNGQSISPDAVTDIEKLKPSYTNMLELGYKGTVGSRLFLAFDGWYQRRENFTTAAQNFTPNALLDGPTLGAALAAHLIPVLGAAGAAQVATAVAGSLARIPLGTVVPESRVTTNGDIAFTYRSIDKAINLHGVDVAFDYMLANNFSTTGTYSWMSDTEFDIEAGQLPLTLNSPDHKASLAFKFNGVPRNLTAEIRGRYQNTFRVNSAVFVTGVDLTAPDGSKYQYRQPPTATFLDAQITWRLPMTSARGALISLSGTNLLDNKVPLFAGVPEIGRLIMTRLQFTL